MTIKELIKRNFIYTKWLQAAGSIDCLFVYGCVFIVTSFLLLLNGAGGFAIARCFCFCVAACLIASAIEWVGNCMARALRIEEGFDR